MWSYLSLFTSLSTLLCCALPSLLVLLGLGATVASFLAGVPGLVTLSHHKIWVFAISGSLIALSWLQTRFRPSQAAVAANCSADDANACSAAARFSRVVLWTATGIYSVGFFVAYILGYILNWMDR